VLVEVLTPTVATRPLTALHLLVEGMAAEVLMVLLVMVALVVARQTMDELGTTSEEPVSLGRVLLVVV
jgi:hypothetical protein